MKKAIGHSGLAFLLFAQSFAPHYAFANPQGGTVTDGSASISGEGTATVTITQSSDRTVVEWDSFSVGATEQVIFQQPSSAALAANKVIGTAPSEIFGQISANGQVLIINGNGMVFGRDSVIDAASFIATTHDISNYDIMTGDDALDFSGGTASIRNEGTITVQDGGIAALLAPNIHNDGVITARLGTISLAASQSISVDFYGDGLLSFSADSALSSALQKADSPMIDQQGTLSADGGLIQMTAKAASDVINQSVNIGGLVRARTAETKNGRIILSGDTAIQLDTGAQLDTSGDSTAGDIAITASSVSLGGQIDASGGSQGGDVAITASGLVALSGEIDASASSGAGGTIIVRADRITENNSSTLDASGATKGGTISVTGTSRYLSSGSYDASASSGTGGLIDVTSWDVRALSASYDASGPTQAGRIRIGGAFQGGKDLDFSQSYIDSFVTRWPDTPALANAGKTFINDGTHINVSSQNGAGGTAVIWSDVETTFLGSLSATGTTGGSVEISSAATLRYASLSNVDVGDGTLLLDPKNITIGSSAEVQSWSYRGVIGRWYRPDISVVALDASDAFGESVALSDNGQLMAVGATGDDDASDNSDRTGAVYLFTFTDSNFSGGSIDGVIGKSYTGGKNVNLSALGTKDVFGSSVSLDSDGNRLAVGAVGDDGNTNSDQDAGAVYLFSFTDTAFSSGSLTRTIGKGYSDLSPTNLAAGDYFGSSVALNGAGTRLLVGAENDDGASNTESNSGAVYMLSFSDANFTAPSVVGVMGSGYSGGDDLDVTTVEENDRFGSALDVTSDTERLIVGARGDDGSGASDASSRGAAYIIDFENDGYKNPAVISIFGYDYKTGNDVEVNLDNSDAFGASVAISNDKLLYAVGVPYDDGQSMSGGANYGAVYLFRFTNTDLTGNPTTSFLGRNYSNSNDLSIDSLATNDAFGSSIAMNGAGSRLAVGISAGDGDGGPTDSGEVMLISFSDSQFSSPSRIAMVGDGYVAHNYANNTNLEAGERFGTAVALNAAGDRMAVGYTNDGGSPDTATNYGAVALYSFSNSLFGGATLEGTIGKSYAGSKDVDFDSGGDDRFGTAVALNGTGDRLAVGESSENSKGAVRLFTFTDGDFSGGALAASIADGASGGNNVSVSLDTNDEFGTSVALSDDGKLLAIGASGDDGTAGTDTGAVYLYRFNDSDFTGGTLSGRMGSGYSNTGDVSVTLAANDLFGTSVALDGDGNLLAVGASGDAGPDANTGAGAVLLFQFGDTSFTSGSLRATIGDGYSTGRDINVANLAASDAFGSSVALNGAGNRLAVGAVGDDGSTPNSGAVYLFDFTDDTFASGSQVLLIGDGYTSANQLDVSTLGASDGFGNAVAFNGQGNLLAVGSSLDDGSFDTETSAGAVHLFSATHASGGYYPEGQTFANLDTNSVTVNAYEIADLLNRGTNLTLQASNDITVSSAVQVAGFAQSPGDLTLQAGRSLLVNQSLRTEGGDITLIANDTVANGVVDSQRDSGAATIAIGSATLVNAGSGDVSLFLRNSTDKTNNTSGDISLAANAQITGNTVTIRNAGPTSGSDITLAAGASINASATGDAITLISDNFINASSSSAVNPSAGRFQIWTNDAAGDTLNGLTPDFIQYGATYGVSTIAGGASENGVFYTTTATVSPDFRYGATKTYDGSTTATVADNDIGVSGANAGETVVLTASSATYDNRNVGSGKTVTLSGLSVASASKGAIDVYGYTVSTNTASNSNGAITYKALNLSGQTVSNKVYDRNTTASVSSYGTLTGIVDGDTVTLDSSSAASNFQSAAVGTNKTVTIASLALSGADATNYRIANQSATADITAKALSLSSASAANKTYDANQSATITAYGALSGVIGADTVSLDTSSVSASFDTANVGTGKTVTLSSLGITGSDAGNYSLSSSFSTTADITAKALTIASPSATNKTYDANDTASVTAGNLSGFVGSETVTVTASGQFDNANVGTGKSVTVTYSLADGTNGGLASNYSLASGSTTADITAKALSIAAPTATNKTYDANDTASVTAGSLSGFVGSETLTVTASGQFDNANVGTGKSVSVTYSLADGTNGGLASNYSLASGATTANITAKALSITSPTATNKTYDGNDTASVTAGSLSGFVGSETVTVTASGQFDNANVGTGKSVSVTYSLADGTNGGLASNYSLASGATTANISAKALSITSPTLSNKTYDGDSAITVSAGTLSGLIGSQTLGISATGAASDANVAAGKSVTVTYNLSDGSNGGLATNYSLANGSGTADITAKALTITSPSATNKTYDGNDTASVTAGNLSGFVGSETLTVTASGQFDSANAGNGRTVTVTYNLADGTNGGLASNYSLASGSTSADITAKALTITNPTATNKTYDANNTITTTAGTLSGLIGSQTLTVTASGTTSDSDAGTGKYVTVAYNLADGTNGGLAANYSLADGSASVDITPKALSYSSVSVANKVYDGTQSASVTASGLSGFVGSETVTALNQGTFADGNVGTNKNVSVSFALSNGTNGGKASNYSIASVTRQANITAKALSISGSTAANKVYDATTTAAIQQGTITGFIGNESLTITSSGQFADANIGANKAVSVTYNLANGGNGGLASNYTLAGETLNATISKRFATISGLSVQNKTYDGTDTASVTSYGSLTNIISGDAVTLDTSAGNVRFANAKAGSQALVITGLSLGGSDASNYDITLPSATGIIARKALTITGSKALSKSYDATRSAVIDVGTLSGFIGAQTLTASGTGLFNDAQPGLNKSVLVQYLLSDGLNGGEADNYLLAPETLFADIEGQAKDKADITAPMIEKQIKIIKDDVKIEREEKLEMIEQVEAKVIREEDSGPAFIETVGDWTILSCENTDAQMGMCSAK